MIIQIRNTGDVRILDFSGKITLGEGTQSLRNAVRNALESGTKKIILNLKEVSYLDSSGLGELMRAYTSVTNGGGRLKLLHVTERIRELLLVAKLLPLFEVYDDEKTAIVSFEVTAHSQSAKSSNP
jgi:anti-sigma B factor antagonist